MELYGALNGFDGERLHFEQNLRACLDDADRTYNGINAGIDTYIAAAGVEAPPPSVYAPVWAPDVERGSLALSGSGVSAIVWCIGFRPDFRWLDAPVFNGAGQPKHARGVANYDGVYFLGLPWLHTWGSGRFSGVGRDALHLADAIEQRLRTESRAPRPLRAAG
jgi:putative flavoprotein involved in K+ transport